MMSVGQEPVLLLTGASRGIGPRHRQTFQQRGVAGADDFPPGVRSPVSMGRVGSVITSSLICLMSISCAMRCPRSSASPADGWMH